MGTREEEVEEVMEVVGVTIEAVEAGEEEEVMEEIIMTMMMTVSTTDTVIVTGVGICMTLWSVSRGPTTRRTRTSPGSGR